MPDGVEQSSFLPEKVFDFEIEATDEPLIARAGLVLPHQMAVALGLPRKIDCELPAPGSPRGYAPSAFAMPILLMLHGGGKVLDDLRELQAEVSLRELLQMKQLPDSTTVGDWLRRMGQDGRGLDGLERVNDHLSHELLQRSKDVDYTLDVDATIIESEKEAASWTYKKVKGYQPMLGFLQRSGELPVQASPLRGLIVADEFREGNVPAGARAVAFLRKCKEKLPAGKRLGALRSDSAWYQAEVFNWCQDEGVRFAIGADQDRAVKEAIHNIEASEWKAYRKDREIAQTVHTMNGTKRAFRLVVQRWPKEQPDLFDPQPYFYHAIASGGLAEEEAETPEEVVAFYNQRGEIENWIKELKEGFGMDWMPCGETFANAVYFRLGVIAYNLFVAMKVLSLPGRWQRYTVATVRWRLYETAGRVLYESRRVVLKLATTMEKVKLLLAAQRSVQRLAMT
ncbi:MAG: IS1380 family transposase [Chloroflexi bacterium]|nr:IS1380 family transposase [Chloroflexota bacterium]